MTELVLLWTGIFDVDMNANVLNQEITAFGLESS